jgi:S1-C subfamily serine protease
VRRQQLADTWPIIVASLLLTACSGSGSLPTSGPTAPGATFGGGLAGQTISGTAWEKAVEQVKSATVLVSNQGCGFQATGSAVAMTSDELVTNEHVVEGARSMSIVTASGHRVAVRNWVVSKSDDLALLWVSKPVFDHPVKVASSATVPGNLVVAMGYPLGGPFTIGRGRVLDVTPDPLDSGPKMIEASVDILPGNSGGPLLDTTGQLVGIVRAINLETGSALAIPSARVVNLMAGKSSRPGQPC